MARRLCWLWIYYDGRRGRRGERREKRKQKRREGKDKKKRRKKETTTRKKERTTKTEEKNTFTNNEKNKQAVTGRTADIPLSTATASVIATPEKAVAPPESCGRECFPMRRCQFRRMKAFRFGGTVLRRAILGSSNHPSLKKEEKFTDLCIFVYIALSVCIYMHVRAHVRLRVCVRLMCAHKKHTNM